MRANHRTAKRTERGSALVLVVIFTFLSVAGAVLFLERTHVELRDGRQKAASVKSLFAVHSSLARAHAVINEEMNSQESLALQKNVALAQPEEYQGRFYVRDTNFTVEVRTVKPSDVFDEFGNEIPPPGGYQPLPANWYVLEARVFEPLLTRSDGSKVGALKLVRQYVRDGTPLSNNFVAVIDDDLGLGGSPVNPGKPAEGEIQTNKHLYIMTANPYYANRLLAVDGVSYIAGATEENTVFLHPDNNFNAEPLYLPLPDSLTENPNDPDDTLKAYALGQNPQPVALVETNPDYSVDLKNISDVSQLRLSGSDPVPQVSLNFDDGVCVGVTVEGNVDSKVEFQGSTLKIELKKANDPSKKVVIEGLPTPQNGVVFFDTIVPAGGEARRTELLGQVSTRTTLATTGNVDVVGSVRYVDDEGDPATKLVYSDDIEGVPEELLGQVPEIPDNEVIPTNASVEYFANERPYGVAKQPGDGFYDGNAVLGVVASQDIILTSQVPQNAEIAGAYLSLEKRLTLEGMGYDANGNLVWIDGTNDFYVYNGARSSIRRFGSLVSYKRPATAVVTWTGWFLYGFRRGFSLFDEKMKQEPPPYFPKDKKPQYLGWELKDLGVKEVPAP